MDLTTNNTPITFINYIKGGLGNQLFQHVFALSLAKKFSADLFIDTSYYDSDPYGFNASIVKFTNIPNAHIGEHAGDGCYLLKDNAINSLKDSFLFPNDAKCIVLSGYWQREDLLDPLIVENVYNDLSSFAQNIVSPELTSKLKSFNNSVAIHIRRRDYAHMGLCKDSYYLSAIDHLKLNYPDAKFFIFSDEPNYAKHLLLNANLEFEMISSKNDIGDIYLMSLCKHFVIANSSYSWWAAYFSEKNGGLIFHPKEWVTIDTTPSPCPSRWNQIENAIIPFAINITEVNEFSKKIQKQRFNIDINRWFACSGDSSLRVNFNNLNENSIVFDLGGYKGDWTSEISSRYGSSIYIFEPVPSFHKHITNRFDGLKNIHPCNFGLGSANKKLEFHLSADGTGTFGDGGALEFCDIVCADEFMKKNKIEKIDLMKINIEGGEYELLEHFISTGFISKIKKLQIQFHDFVPNAISRRASILNSLNITHNLNWSFYFVWEEWTLQNDFEA